MTWWSRAFRTRGLRRRRAENELDEEIRFHLDLEVEERRGAGVTACEAELAARREFGNMAQVREVTRQMWGWNWADRVWRDLRYSIRALRRSPVFAVTAVLSLALGIGVNVAAFSLADAFLFRPAPVERPWEVVAINGETAQNRLEGVSYPDLQDLRGKNGSFSGVVGYTLARFAFAPSPAAVPQMRMGMHVTQAFFQVLGVRPVLGRAFTDGECGIPGRDAVTVLGYDFWQQQFGGDAGVIGATIRLNGVPFQVIGVAPEAFTGMDPFIRPAMFVPVTMAPRLSRSGHDHILDDRGSRSLNLRARLKLGVSIARARAELAAFSKALEREYPEADRDRVLRARTELELRVQQAPPTAMVAVLLLVLAGLVLVIACANVASLLLARARARSREIAVRLAIGAGRGRLVQQFLTESVVLALCGGVAGLAVAYGSIRYLAAIRVPTDTPMAISTQLDDRVLGFTLAVSVVSAVLFGLVPALRSVRPEIAPALKAGEVAPAGRRRHLGRSILVSSQVALSLVLLVISTTLLDAFRRMLVVDPGIRTGQVMMFEFDPSLIGYSADQTRIFYRQLVERTRNLPDVRSVTLSRAVPFRPNFTDEALVPEGYTPPRNQDSVTVSTNSVDEHYFETMKTPILQGRGFTTGDTETSRRVAVVNQEFANRYWSGQDAVGRRFRRGVNGPYVEVVGVARTGKYLSLAETPQPYVYFPFPQKPSSRMTLFVQTEGPPAAMTDPVLRVVHTLDANQPVYNVRPFDTFYEQGVLGPALVVMQMVGSTGLLGLVLALVGLYGLIAYSVSRRTREIGIRMAIGAGRGMVLRMILRQGIALSLAGVGAGLAVSFPVFRMLSSALAGLGVLSPLTLVIVPCALVLITMCACWIPALRASRIDPTRALRYE